MIPWFERPVIYDVRARPHLVESTSGSRDLQMVPTSLVDKICLEGYLIGCKLTTCVVLLLLLVYLLNAIFIRVVLVSIETSHCETTFASLVAYHLSSSL